MAVHFCYSTRYDGYSYAVTLKGEGLHMYTYIHSFEQPFGKIVQYVKSLHKIWYNNLKLV